MTTRREATKAAAARLKAGEPCPSPLPTALKPGSIKTEPELFQFRNPLQHASRAHVDGLAKPVRDGAALDPVEVWWGGDGWYCIDGHHRLDAYQRGGWPSDRSIPVRAFEGSLERAMLAAGHRNAPDKLQMHKSEKTQAAWEFVASTLKEAASAETISKAFAISVRMVRFMRSVRRKLAEEAPSEDPSQMSWEAARRRTVGEEDEPRDAEQWEERDRIEGARMADKLAAVFGKRGQQRSAALAYALEIYDPRFPAFAAEHWSEYRPQEEENPDF